MGRGGVRSGVEVGWDGVGLDGVSRDETKRVEMGWDGVGAGWDGVGEWDCDWMGRSMG